MTTITIIVNNRSSIASIIIIIIIITTIIISIIIITTIIISSSSIISIASILLVLLLIIIIIISSRIIIRIIIRIRDGTAEYLEPSRAKILLVQHPTCFSPQANRSRTHPVSANICKVPTHDNNHPVVHSDHSKAQKMKS